MLNYNIFEARQNFSKIIEEVTKKNQTCIISKSNQPIAKITAIDQLENRKIGLMKGKIKIADDFDDPLPEEVLDSFNGSKG